MAECSPLNLSQSFQLETLVFILYHRLKFQTANVIDAVTACVHVRQQKTAKRHLIKR